MTEDQNTQIRMNALSEAIRAHGGTGLGAEDIVAAAEKYVAFVTGARAPKKVAKKRK